MGRREMEREGERKILVGCKFYAQPLEQLPSQI
jgi:hypothetical protein